MLGDGGGFLFRSGWAPGLLLLDEVGRAWDLALTALLLDGSLRMSEAAAAAARRLADERLLAVRRDREEEESLRTASSSSSCC